MPRRFRLSLDGYLDLRDQRRVRTPGWHDHKVVAMPEDEAVAFLLSHTFPGHRRVVRRLSETHRKRIQIAIWADSVSERMSHADRVWRAVTDPVPPPPHPEIPYLIQMIRCGDRAYPLYLSGGITQVIPHGGIPAPDVAGHDGVLMDLRTA